MKLWRNLRLGLGLLLIWMAAFCGGGCATDDYSQEMSSRPWNSPRNWEHGLPSGMYEGR